uniref:GTPase n=1 Tax=Thermofilum pendens TaxID=2269 RepID=A0A7C4FC10_THEPE
MEGELSGCRRRVIILGAGGRDFHNFNVLFRNNPKYEVMAFVVTQIPNIDNRVYPPELAGPLYPGGIPILSARDLEKIISERGVKEVYLSYSDLTCEELAEVANRVVLAGANLVIPSPLKSMLRARKPVIAVTASRTGAGKSTVSRYVARVLRELGVRYVIIRHPMPYGDLKNSIVQRFASYEDLERYNCTIEEREEYEPHIAMGNVVYAGVDYELVLREAEKEADIIVWDGGNNDVPFVKPDLYITVVDPTRPRDVVSSFPGAVNVALADIIVVNKVNIAREDDVRILEGILRKVNPRAKLIEAASVLRVDRPDLIRGKRVVVVEDGPTVTHGSLSHAAGFQAALEYGARDIIDPRPYAVGNISEAYDQYPWIGKVVPALGYGVKQMKDLEETLNRVPADTIVMGTPSDLSRFLKLNKPVARVFFELRELSGNELARAIAEFVKSFERAQA